MIEVELPDGTVVEFPEGTSPDVMKGALQKRFGKPQQPMQSAPQMPGMRPDAMQAAPQQQASANPAMGQGLMQTAMGFTPAGIAGNLYQAAKDPAAAFQSVDDSVRMLANGASFGYADKLAGYMGGNGADAERTKSKQAKERLGLTGDVLEMGGSMLPATRLANLGVTATKLPGMIGKYGGMAMDGAVLGTLSASGNDKDVKQGAMYGAAGGVAGQGLAKLLSGVAGKIGAKPALPTVDDLKAKSKAAYQEAESAGVIIKPQAMDRLRQGVYDDYADFGYHPELQPGAKVAYGEIDRLSKAGNVDLKGLDGLRKIASGGFSPMNPSNNALLGKTTSKIDEFLETLQPADVLTGDPAKASEVLKTARSNWGQASKLQRVDDLLEKAGLQAGSTGSGGNAENATRQKLKTLLTNPKLTRGMTKDEIAATKKAVLGSTGQNMVRLAGKLSPGGNGLMTFLQGAGAIASSGATLPFAAIGYGAKKTAEGMTMKNADMLRAIIASGGKKANLPDMRTKAQKQIEANKQLIARLIMGGAITEASAQ